MRRVVPAGVLILFTAVACRVVEPASVYDDAAAAIEIRAELAAIAVDLENGGPAAWLPHFVRDGTFWMASEGELKFPTYADAEVAVLGFAPSIERMELLWPDPRVEVLGPELASFGVDYAELLVQTDGEEAGPGNRLPAERVTGAPRPLPNGRPERSGR